MKRQATDKERHMQLMYPTKDLDKKYFKKSYMSIRKRESTQINKNLKGRSKYIIYEDPCSNKQS